MALAEDERRARRVDETLARLRSALPGGGEDREGQREMAQAVAGAIAGERHVVVRAGTGTGKSLAYLVPIALAGRPVVIATATKALQDQLAAKDLPMLVDRLRVSWTVLKGRQNYLCRQRLDELVTDRQLALEGIVGASDGVEVDRLVAWAGRTLTGDRAELEHEPSPAAWAAVSVGPHECPGPSDCPQGSNCFSEAARAAAARSTIVVVNTHLYGVHLAAGGDFLPAHDIVVFDEAHQLEDTISATAGFELSASRVAALARPVRALVHDDLLHEHFDKATAALVEALASLHGQRLAVSDEPGLADALERVRTMADRANEAVRLIAEQHDEERKGAIARIRRLAGELMLDIDLARQLPDTYVSWVGGPTDRPALLVAPIDVGETLKERLWPNVATAVLTSATITATLPEAVGLPEGTTVLDVGSPFDYATNGLLYCAAHLPDPRTAAFEPAMHAELAELLALAGGRTLALFTSWRAVDAAAAAVRQRTDLPILTQRDKPKPALLKAFRDDPATCLFATMGFWQGVDVPGDTLSMVTIDRLPFPRPDDPLLQARRERIGAQAFRRVDLARAATMLAQGTGRLIRSATDRGVVAVLDRRLATNRGYRWDLINALPPYRRTKDRADVAKFFA